MLDLRQFSLAILCLPFFASAQTGLPVFPGQVKSVQCVPASATIRTDNAQAEITAYSPTILRVRIDRGVSAADPSWAVIRQAGKFLHNPTAYNDSVILSTDSLIVVVHRKPMSITVKNLAGAVLSEEEPGMPVSWMGTRVTCYRHLFSDEKFLGLGEKTGNLDKRGNSFENWNSDVPAYAANHDPLYQSIPFFIGVHGRVVYGIFLDNTSRTHFNFGASTDEQFSSFSADEGSLNYYFFGASTIGGILSDYTWLTGRMTLPPYWSLGYQQCRWSYFPESQVMSIAQQFRDKHIPCDVIWLDIDYMDHYKIFTWNQDRFPDPKAMTSKLNGMGFHVVTIVDPGIKIEKGYFAYDEGLAGRFFATWPDGRNYTGSVWPGRCHFPDFTREKVRKWWGASFNRLVDAGVEGFWNDMNEPSAWGQSIPDIVQFDGDYGKSSMTRVHNIYGLEMSRATCEGTRELMKGKRPLILTRAGYAGIQRYSAVWTGDNDATDEHMLLSARMVTGLGLSGVSFTGPDIGGFMGNPSENLYTRWMAQGVYTPFFRNHSAWDTKSKEPWSFGPEVERKVREMIKTRYRMLPYVYSAMYESTVSGMPVARSLAIPYTFDEKVYWWKYQNEYLFGGNLLVAPVSCEQSAARIYLPEGSWYRVSTGQKYDGHSEVTVDAPLDDLPVFAKESAILPMQSDIEHTGQKPSPTLELHIYNGNKSSSFVYYEDDGISYDYEKGSYFRRLITFDPTHNTILVSAAEGTFVSRFTAIRLVLHDFTEPLEVQVDGEGRSLKLRSNLEKFTEFPWRPEQMTITY
ncbi:MAG TPA: glycoside hydrolase family 31 protein [Bacteroidales bacterium]|nr:glycoside hydrolase family 31 protein [Bacteroidales bacterium]